MRLLITQCVDPMRWYAELVGQAVPFLGDAGGEYRSREPSGAVNFVQYGDARVIDDDCDPALAAITELADTLDAEAAALTKRAAQAITEAAVRRHGAEDLRRSVKRLEAASEC